MCCIGMLTLRSAETRSEGVRGIAVALADAFIGPGDVSDWLRVTVVVKVGFPAMGCAQQPTWQRPERILCDICSSASQLTFALHTPVMTPLQPIGSSGQVRSGAYGRRCESRLLCERPVALVRTARGPDVNPRNLQLQSPPNFCCSPSAWSCHTLLLPDPGGARLGSRAHCCCPRGGGA